MTASGKLVTIHQSPRGAELPGQIWPFPAVDKTDRWGAAANSDIRRCCLVTQMDAAGSTRLSAATSHKP
jgi:hypothetical protein